MVSLLGMRGALQVLLGSYADPGFSLLGLVPGGGGLEMLPRLVGRKRALEIVVGADDIDAETAALYGCRSLPPIPPYIPSLTARLLAKGVNRAIPDDKFEDFVETYARRVAGWDKFGIAQAKAVINKRSGFPSTAEWLESFGIYSAAFGQGVVLERGFAMLRAGLQSDVNFEKNLPKEFLRFVGPGPWDT